MSEDRSQSRGREALQSTGRGGFGNIRQASVSRDRTAGGPDDFSVTRGREPLPQQTAPIYSTGRGGAGNLRSPSRDPARASALDPLEKEVIDKHNANIAEAAISTGRGGLGNIARSRSRDQSRSRVRTSGRGGVGNIHEGGDGYDANAADELERRKEGHIHTGPHSTGRGGFANITEAEEPNVERPSISSATNKISSTGRGGAGNIGRN